MPEQKLNQLGIYGSWLEKNFADQDHTHSFLHPRWVDLREWKGSAREIVWGLLQKPDTGNSTPPKVLSEYEYEGLYIEHLSWTLPYGPETRAYFLRPAGAHRPLPGVLCLHDHGGNKYFGKSKMTRTSDVIHPTLQNHQHTYYGGSALANEIAKQGYSVLVHDVFPFESRKIMPSGLPGYVVKRLMTDPAQVQEITPEDMSIKNGIIDYDVTPPDEAENKISLYNVFAGQHEDVIAKSLFSTGLCWPGIFLAEDQLALSHLSARSDVDPERIGCCGLSGGGLRTNYLAGLDDRIRCSVTVGFMTTWRDFALNVAYTHTWMTYIPLLANHLDFPEILGLRVPLPALVLATREDPFFTLKEVQKATSMLKEIYRKARAAESFQTKLYGRPHKFDRPMQIDALSWLNRWLK